MQSARTTAVPGMERGSRRKQINVGRAERKASIIGGAALAMSGVRSLKNRHFMSGVSQIMAGGMLLYRGKTGHCDVYQAIGVGTAGPEDTGMRVEKALTINRTPQEVYEFWRDLENLPRFMRHLESVQVTGPRTSRWKARGPAGMTVEWDAEMMEDSPGQRMSWHSTSDAGIPNEGHVEFHEAPGGRGTEVKVVIIYHPPGGAAGRIAAKVAHALNAQQIEEDLKRLKQILETGELATAQTAPVGSSVL